GGVALFPRGDGVIQRQGAQDLGAGHQGGATHAGAARIGDLEVEPVACEDAVLQAQGDRQIVSGTKVHDVQTARSASGHGASLPGSVSQVEMTTPMALICKAVFPSLSTFETP